MREFKATSTETTSHFGPIEPLQPPLSREKPQKIINGWQKLLVSAEKVNQLSEQLEQALFELKVTASEIKCHQNSQPILTKIFKHKLIVVPCIRYKKPGVIIVTARKIDLFQQEREAFQAAQMLRRRTKRRLKRPIQTTLSNSSKIEYQSTSFIGQLILTWQKLNIAIGRKSTAPSRPTRINTISC